MKKIISLLLVLVLLLSMVSCNKAETKNENTGNNNEVTNEKDNEEEVVVPNKATISVQVETGWLAHYEAVKARILEKNPDATINLIETGAFDHLEVLDSTDVTNVDVADVFAIPADRVYPLAQNEALATIDVKTMAANVGNYENYDEGLGGNLKVGDDYLAFPMNIESLVIFANSANAEANGIDLTSTIEFTDLNPEDMLVPVFNAWFGVALTNAAEIELLSNVEGLNSDLTKEFSDLSKEKQELFTSLFNYWKVHDEAGTDLWDKDAVWGYMDSEFTSGNKASLRLEGPWSTANLSEKANDGEDLVVLPINTVTINGNPLAHWKGGWGLAVNARVEGQDEQMALATMFIEEVVNTEYAVDFFKTTDKILPNVSLETYKNSDLRDIDKVVIEAVIKSFDAAPARPLFTEWG